MHNARSFIRLQIFRCINSSNMYSNSNREAKFMKKLMNGNRKLKRKWFDTNIDISSLNLKSNTSPSMHVKRRMEIRDKLFMQHITDMMSMGEVSDIISGGMEITHVKITQDFKYVNVFYIPNNDDILFNKEALQKCAKIIRHELSQLRIIGIVPPIQFVQDKQYLMQKEVEQRLTKISLEEELSCEQMELDIDDQNSHEKTDQVDKCNIQFPLMRHDVLGLDHHKIMSQITVAVSKSRKAIQKQIKNVNNVNDIDKNSCDSVSKRYIEFPTRKEQQAVLSEFLKKRRKEEKLKYRLKQNNQQILNYIEENTDNEKCDYEDYSLDDGYVDDDFNNEYINDDIDNEYINDHIDNEYIDDSKDKIQK